MGLGGSGNGQNLLAVGVQDRAGHAGFPGRHRKGVHLEVAVGLGGDEDAVGAVVHQIKVGLRDLNQGDVPVQAAVEGEVGLLGVDVAGAVVHHHPDLPAALGHDLGDVHPEGGEAALVGPQ